MRGAERRRQNVIAFIAISNAFRFTDVQLCKCSAALMQKHIGQYLLTAAPSHGLIVVL